jgi:hypothetical protein
MTSNETKVIKVEPEEFDLSRVVIKDSTKTTFTLGDAKTPIENYGSEAFYLNNKNEECELYFEAPQQLTFGVSYCYDLGEKNQVPENAKGMQLCYPLTSMKTVNTPTPKEKAVKDMIDQLYTLCVKKAEEEAKRPKKELKIPELSCILIKSAMSEGGGADGAVKPPYDHPNGKDKQNNVFKDTTKPVRMYVKLITTKTKKLGLVCLTRVYDSNDQPGNGKDLLDLKCRVGPLMRFLGIYWGAHGPKSPYGASLRFQIAELTYVPSEGSKLPPVRLISKSANPHPSEKEDGDDEGFTGVGDPENNPVKQLQHDQPTKPPIKAPVKLTAKPPSSKPSAPAGSSAVPKGTFKKPLPKSTVNKTPAKPAAVDDSVDQE